MLRKAFVQRARVLAKYFEVFAFFVEMGGMGGVGGDCGLQLRHMFLRWPKIGGEGEEESWTLELQQQRIIVDSLSYNQ